MDRIEEVFAPASITTVEGFIAFVVGEILRRGGDPSTLRVVNTAEAIPNVKFSEDWPCWTVEWDQAD